MNNITAEAGSAAPDPGSTGAAQPPVIPRRDSRKPQREPASAAAFRERHPAFVIDLTEMRRVGSDTALVAAIIRKLGRYEPAEIGVLTGMARDSVRIHRSRINRYKLPLPPAVGGTTQTDPRSIPTKGIAS